MLARFTLMAFGSISLKIFHAPTAKIVTCFSREHFVLVIVGTWACGVARSLR
jgi:hypothetical protein